jgi:hypothetical protein
LVIHRVNQFSDGTFLCYLDWKPELDEFHSPRAFYLLITITLYILPLACISAMYITIIDKLWRRQVPGNRTEMNRRAAIRSRQSVIKMLIVVLVVFALCWLPVHILHILINFYYPTYQRLPPWTVMVLFWVSHANSAINPYIFITMNQSFKKITLSILKCTNRRNSHETSRSRVSYSGFLRSRKFVDGIQEYTLSENITQMARLSPQALLGNATNRNERSSTYRYGPTLFESTL